ncbi:MAG: DNA-processing protein DprA [Candidatus Cloacimonetes bacterium]|jgi:DNA processing protein|nr:DNA-processing protein DprA [Candidatus Cloacimonadota bacterium]MDY0337525.1 DNA-processing protein DprA [Candidatus Cloacimonadaceae bacterium]MCB5269765.1 DNA-processing protein DprA [Candidatus Cloacimonadota bacterium]MCK9333970.1 DNA-processing protein DprA [Candidatus Cloacimonadota bacterium]MDD2544520.1 DNA-processing protein DprA [Candidatus Cloacimonadota bacterium]
MHPEQYLPYLCLKTAPQLSVRNCINLLDTYPDPAAFVGVPDHPLYQQGILKSDTIEHLKSFVLPPNQENILQLMKQHQIQCLAYNEDAYPAKLREIFAPPLLLYVRGDLNQALKPKCLAVVGTRKATTYGREMCRKLLDPLCKEGVCIISGLALGIDTQAHLRAINNQSPTIAALASGLESVYPPVNRQLADKIVESGALISEYEPGSKADKWNFPARNRLISALSDAVLVVEGPITSGAMLTAKAAIEQNRDICALPGYINIRNSEGPNHLIKNGAALISSAEDLFALLQMTPENSQQIELFPELCPDEQRICDLLKDAEHSLSFDELLIQSSFTIGRLSTHLTNLELKGVIAKESGNSFFLC